MTSKDSYHLEEQVGFLLRSANQRHLEVFTAMMPDVTSTQFAVLAKLRERGTLSQNHLGRLVRMDAATIKGVVDRLKKKQFVGSTPSKTDMRRLEIYLTSEGREFTDQAMATAVAISEKTTANLTRREVARLIALLEKL